MVKSEPVADHLGGITQKHICLEGAGSITGDFLGDAEMQSAVLSQFFGLFELRNIAVNAEDAHRKVFLVKHGDAGDIRPDGFSSCSAFS